MLFLVQFHKSVYFSRSLRVSILQVRIIQEFFFFLISMNRLLPTRSNQSATKLELVINSKKLSSSVTWISKQVYKKGHRIRHKEELN